MSISTLISQVDPKTHYTELAYKQQILLYIMVARGVTSKEYLGKFSNGIKWTSASVSVLRELAAEASREILGRNELEYLSFCRELGIDKLMVELSSSNYLWPAHVSYFDELEINKAIETYSCYVGDEFNTKKGLMEMLDESDKTVFKVLLIILAVVALCCTPFSCTPVAPDAGHEAVLVDKPIFGSGGIRKEVVTTGRKYIWFTTDAIYVNMLPQVVTVKFDDLASSDRFLLDFTAQVRMRYTDSYALVTSVGEPKGAWDRTLDPFFRALVRDNVKKYKMENLMTDDKSAGQIDTDITAAIEAYILAKKIPIQILDITLGQAKPNAEIVNQMNATSAELQRKGQMEAKAAAELQRKVAEKNRAAADNEYRNQLGYTTEQYLNLRTAEIQAEACKTAAGGCVYYNGTAPLVTSNK